VLASKEKEIDFGGSKRGKLFSKIKYGEVILFPNKIFHII